jgi:glycosyltransferase involved in cell wall biosynthesis
VKISIVTISYNQAEFLEEAILSVLNQNYSDIEYIVVDPGSTDGSREIIEKYKDQIEHIIFEPDEGPADGLNRGFEVATGNIFGYLNADDILLPTTVSHFIKCFQSSSADVISGHGYIIDRDGGITKKVFSDKFDPVAYVYGACVLVQQSSFFKAESFKHVGGFNKDNGVSWDGELCFDMALNGSSFKQVQGFWSCFRVYEESITGSGEFNEKAREVLIRHAKKINQKGIDSWLKKKLYWLKVRLFDPVLTVKKVVDKF